MSIKTIKTNKSNELWEGKFWALEKVLVEIYLQNVKNCIVIAYLNSLSNSYNIQKGLESLIKIQKC